MLNRLHNVKNPNQGRQLKVLCVCSAGLLRSPTAAKILWQEHHFNTRAAGTSQEYALIPVDEVLVEWADEIVCMGQEQVDELEERFEIKVPIFSLGIPDSYPYMHEELIHLIKKRYLECTC